MPLCVDDMGQHGCHTAFDRYSLIDGGRQAHVELGKVMARQLAPALTAAEPPELDQDASSAELVRTYRELRGRAV